MNDVLVAAAGCITPLGHLEETFTALMAGRSGLAVTGLLDGPLSELPFGAVAGLDGAAGSLTRLRSLMDALFTTVDGSLMPLLSRLPLILATTKGASDHMMAEAEGTWQGPCLASVISEVLSPYGLGEGGHVVSAACASGTIAVIEAARLVGSGRAEAALVLGFEILSRFVSTGFWSLKVLDPRGARPFDVDRKGLSLGEGAALILVAHEEFCRDNGLEPLCRIEGCGVTCDAFHVATPMLDGTGLKRAISRALAGRQRPGGINAHGTGTFYNDQMEINAFTALWPDRHPPFHSVKGSLGHSLGAAGVIETAIAVRSLQEGLLPPTVGLERSEPGLNVDGSAPMPLEGQGILCCNSGFGGVNAAIMLDSM